MKYKEYLRQLARLEVDVRQDDESGKKSVSSDKFIELISIVESLVEDLKQKEKDEDDKNYYQYMGDDM